ncbi:efflux RND transporter permease subunit [Alteromonas sp. KUL49]|uniref:efflux RND transporter permease subunit n=1 Tax=Alteromonas sp. KUL49 TaxID=2480798 RepID=UPI00102F0EA2|nr:efflux RND transporter permease subunit [Alteromonas sp. KUL49]TAP34490.1 efflux RND transporter permease subunit [Alteromonas sp. KUL49]GEA13540.1 multidrug transporter AcrB [Alteromonas sp. KUL49]
MNLTRIAIENNRTTLMAMIAILMFGLMAYKTMPKDYDPGFIIRTAQVITYFPGASPQRVEELVTDKIEKVIQEIPELDFVSSESRTGVSIVSANIKESYKEMRPIWDNLRRKIETVEGDLPDGAQTPIVNDEFGDVFGIVIGMTAEGFTYREMKDIAEQVKDELLHLPEAAKVDIFGAQDERIYIEFDNARLAELGISPSQISDQLSSQNIISSGGAINLTRERISVEPSGNFESVADIGETLIQIPGSDSVQFLRELASIKRSYIDPAKTMVSLNGERGLSIAISMRQGGNNIVLGEQVNETLARLQQVYPIGVEFSLVSFMPQEVEEKVNDFAENLIQAVAVVTLVMLLTLGLRTGLIVAALIPASMISGILLMSFFNISVDQISLAALIISLGMLVDNGIVMSESILVQMEKGKKAFNAAIDSAAELKTPLLVSSLTTAAAFLPIFLAESATGEYTASLFKVVTITLLCSWAISMTIIPMLCVYFLKVKNKNDDSAPAEEGVFYSYYQDLLRTLLRYRLSTIGVTVVLFFVAIQGLGLVPKLFFPPSDRTYFKVELELPIGTKIEETQRVTQLLESYIGNELAVNEERSEGVTNWISYVGSGGPRFLLTHGPKPSSSYYALLVVNVTSLDIIDSVMGDIERHALANYPDLLVKLRKIENGSPIENPVEIRLKGKDKDILFAIVDSIKQQMAVTAGLKSISDDWGLPIKKVVVEINQTRARRAGVTSKDIAVSLQTELSGMELTQYREGDEVIPIIMRSTAADRQDIGKLESLAVYSQSSGFSVPLRQVADISVVWEPANILRRDRFKTVTVGAQIDDSITANEAFADLTPWLASQQEKWPFGYSYELGGEAESSGKANESIAEKLPIAVLIIVLLLVSQFNSIRKATIILLTIPLGLIGVVVGLLAGQSFFGFMTLLGIVSLAGIVINNAIVLLERIKIEHEDNGLSHFEAIVVAAKMRARPILLTTATTVFGLIPLYLGGGEMWEPMALAIIGGLLISTLLTLCVIPVIYALLFGVKPAN